MTNNLKILRKTKGINQTEIAKFIGISQNNYSYWENGKVKIDDTSLQKLADYFEVSIDYLLGREIQHNVTPANLDRSTVKIPILGKIPAGIPIEAIEDIIGHEDIPKSWVENGAEFFALVVKGDSMEPKYYDGDIVIFRKQFDCDSGQNCAVLVNGYDATLKKVIRHPNGITLQPINTKYDPVFYSREDIENLPVRLLGVVVQTRRDE